jgi:hypothetical protein
LAGASSGDLSLAWSSGSSGGGGGVLSVQQWAEVRRVHLVEGVAIKEIVRRTGLARNTVRAALRSVDPPRYRRPARPSKLDPFKEEIHRLLRADRRSPVSGCASWSRSSAFGGGKTIVDDYLREVRPLFVARRTYQRTVYRPAELLQFDLFGPGAEIPVANGQTSRGWVVACEHVTSGRRILAVARVGTAPQEPVDPGRRSAREPIAARPE